MTASSKSDIRETLLQVLESDLNLFFTKANNVYFSHQKSFISAVESCCSFFADWSVWLFTENGSQQSLVLARSFREFALRPLQEVLLKLKDAEEVGQLQEECDNWRTTLPLLFQLTKISLTENFSQKPCQLYDFLFTHLNRVPVDSLSFSILKSIWRQVIHILAGQIRTAFFESLLDDFHSEFFIEHSAPNNDESNRVPFHRFRISSTRQPCFVSNEAAENLLFVMHTTDCNSILAKKQEPVITVKELVETFQKMADYPSKSSLILDSASSKWRFNAARVLSVVIPVLAIRNGLAKLRALLLLGNELIWRAFFDELREYRHIFKLKSIDPKHRFGAQRTLNSILSAVYNEYGTTLIADEKSVDALSEREDTSVPLLLTLNEAGNVIPKYALSDVESIMLARGAPVYCDLFGISFTVRYVGFELKTCYKTLMALYRRAQSTQEDWKLMRFVRIMTLVRMRMASVIDSLDWYVQGNVVQPKIEKLDKILAQNLSGLHENAAEIQIPLLEQFYATQDENVKAMTAQCMLSNPIIFHRYEAIFSSCLLLCASIESANCSDADMKLCVHQAIKAETQFSRNVNLFAKILRNSDASRFESAAICQLQRRLDETRALPSVVIDTLTIETH